MLKYLFIYFCQDGTPTSKTFEHVASEIGAEEAEEVGVEHLLRDIKVFLHVCIFVRDLFFFKKIFGGKIKNANLLKNLYIYI